ncbi:unnamed protein product [Acanthoscelides obtectus]|uniref:Uncharacterized protein n=1 Tax=Acanthoscelides obtectus TaxID=200917 RepID=A0A9P0P2S1_ACAOB|nr:unnamed protein product [Acanthoscelides obtectus]CAK1662502.1 hypothetical protein AOBTE_LOCUS23180 [Acanthoscelides obtectus]
MRLKKQLGGVSSLDTWVFIIQVHIKVGKLHIYLMSIITLSIKLIYCCCDFMLKFIIFMSF